MQLTGDDGLLTALVRRVLQTGLDAEMTDHRKPLDTNNNANDFGLVAGDADQAGASSEYPGGALQGAPGPTDLASPVQRNDIAQSSLLDPTKSSAVAPNRSYDPASGTLTVCRTITNTSTTPTITALRLRLTPITAASVNPSPPAGQRSCGPRAPQPAPTAGRGGPRPGRSWTRHPPPLTMAG